MKSELRPLFDRIVVKESEPVDQRKSGLVLPEGTGATPHPQEGIVIAVGGGMDWWQHVGFEMPVKPGDHVMFPFSAGVHIELNEEKLLVLRVAELLGVVAEVSGTPETRFPDPGVQERR